MSRFLVALLALLMSAPLVPSTASAVSAPTAEEYGVVLNLSGRQRMLSQKMSKEMMLIALGVDAQKNLAELEKTAALFDRTLKGLRDGDKELRLPPTADERIRRQLDTTERVWREYQATVKGVLARGSVTAEDVAVIDVKSVELVEEMNRCVNLYERDASRSQLKSDPGLAVSINLSGKQRMLSQKMSKEFLLVAYGQKDEENKLNLLETFTLFERTLAGLKDGDPTLDLPGTKPEEIRKQLDAVRVLWEGFKPLMEKGAYGGKGAITKAMIEEVARKNLPLLVEMNKAVEMYEREAAK